MLKSSEFGSNLINTNKQSYSLRNLLTLINRFHITAAQKSMNNTTYTEHCKCLLIRKLLLLPLYFPRDNNIAKDCLAKYSNAKGAPVVCTQQIMGHSKLKWNQFQMFSTD